ncbi:Hypothetical predicted protein, partial [Pelobates cultripes]
TLQSDETAHKRHEKATLTRPQITQPSRAPRHTIPPAPPPPPPASFLPASEKIEHLHQKTLSGPPPTLRARPGRTRGHGVGPLTTHHSFGSLKGRTRNREARKGKEGRRHTYTHTSVNTTQGRKSNSTPQTTTRNNCSQPTPKPTAITRATKTRHRPVKERVSDLNHTY